MAGKENGAGLGVVLLRRHQHRPVTVRVAALADQRERASRVPEAAAAIGVPASMPKSVGGGLVEILRARLRPTKSGTARGSDAPTCLARPPAGGPRRTTVSRRNEP